MHQSRIRRLRAPVWLGIVLVCATFVDSASSQGESAYASRHPLRFAANANALILIEEWAIAAKRFRMLAEARPDDADAAYHLGLCLARAGRTDDARSALERAAHHPAVQARAWFELACLEAGVNNAEAAAAALGAAIDRGYFAKAAAVRKMPCFRTVRSSKDVVAQLDRLAPAPQRLRELAANGSADELVALVRAVGHKLDTKKSPTVLGLLRDLVLAHAKARDDDAKAAIAARANAWAAAAGKVFEHDAFGQFATKGLSWGREESRTAEKRLGDVARLASQMRAHRFSAVIAKDREIEADARAIGDPIVAMNALAQRGMAHQSLLIEGRKRKDADGGADWRAAEACFRELRELTERYGELDLRDNALGGLSQLHVLRSASTQRDVEDHAWEAIIMRPKLPYGARGLGFYENLIVQKRRRR